MRKLLLGILLATTLMPIPVVYAADSPRTVIAQNSIKANLLQLVRDGKTMEEAIASMLSESGASQTDIIAGAVLAFPGKAGEIAAFAVSKGVPPNVATQAAVAKAPDLASSIITSVANQIEQMPVTVQQKTALTNSMTAGAQAAGVSPTVINAALANSNANPGAGAGANPGGVGNPQQQPQQQQQVVNNPSVGGGGTSCAPPKVIRAGSCS